MPSLLSHASQVFCLLYISNRNFCCSRNPHLVKIPLCDGLLLGFLVIFSCLYHFPLCIVFTAFLRIRKLGSVCFGHFPMQLGVETVVTCVLKWAPVWQCELLVHPRAYPLSPKLWHAHFLSWPPTCRPSFSHWVGDRVLRLLQCLQQCSHLILFYKTG